MINLQDLEPGTKLDSNLKAFKMSDGSDLMLEFVVIRGASNGPTLYLGAGIHGDEVSSIGVVGAVLDSIDPRTLSGTLLAVPVENPLAYRARSRFAPTDPRTDMYDSFPGRADGGTSQILAHFLYENLISKANYVIDLHTAGGTEDTVTNSYFAPTRLGEAALKSKQLAEVFGADHYNEEYDGHDGYMHVFLAAKGIPAIVVELSKDLSNAIAAGRRGTLNVLATLGMTKGEVGPKSKILVRGPPNRPTPRVTSGGFLLYHKKLGERVSKDEVIAEVIDPFGRKLEEVNSPVDGLLQTMATSPTIEPGQRVGRIAIEEKNQ